MEKEISFLKGKFQEILRGEEIIKIVPLNDSFGEVASCFIINIFLNKKLIRNYFCKIYTLESFVEFTRGIRYKNTTWSTIYYKMMGYTRCYEYFSEYLDTFEIAKYEFDSLLKLSTIVNAPKPYKLWNIYEVKSAILIMEYIPGIPLVNQKIDEKVINEIFLILKILRDNNFVHGDFRLENLILSDDKKIYIIDPIKTNDSVNIEFRLNLDLAIAIWTLFKKIDKKIVLSIALKYFEKKILVDALMLLPLEVFKEDDEYSNI